MFVRNFLSAGDFLEVVPIGIPITLQYSANGMLEKILEGYENDTKDITSSVKSIFIENELVPRSIAIKTSTSWVSGVLYTSMDIQSIGRIPSETSSVYLEEFIKQPSRFNFFAGCIRSLSTTFRGAVPIRQWLKLAGFEVLPGYVIPASLSESGFEKFISSPQLHFKYPLFMYYIVFHQTSIQYYDLGFRFVKVNNVELSIDDDSRCLVSKIATEPEIEDFHLSYSKVVRFNIQNDCIMLLDESNNVISCKDPLRRKTLMQVTNGRVTCPVCGKVYVIPMSGRVMCPDPHCNSRLYGRVGYFLSTLGLDSMTKSRYDEVTSTIGNIFSVPDVLDLDEYKDCKIECSASTLIRSIVPESIISGPDAFDPFCSRCNNNVDSILYYLDNPNSASKDLQLVKCEVSYVKFLRWLDDKVNVADIKSLFMHPNVTVVGVDKTLLNVAPIFRGTKILITGKFRRGPEKTISSILKSYGAEVVTRYSPDVSMVVVGATRENVSGSSTRRALADNKIIYEENEFFNRFEIDEDLGENL